MEELATPKELDDLIAAIARIPALGTVGIISAIILLLMLVAAWVYVKRLHVKALQRKTDLQLVKDQAAAGPENQAAQDKWDEASGRVAKLRAETGDPDTSPRPKEPGSMP